MNSYEDAARGTYQNRDYARQLVSFEGMVFQGSTGLMNVTPTDIDGFIQLDRENAFIFFEIKHGDPEVPAGQAKALKRLADVIEEGVGNSLLIISTHDKVYTEDVIAGNTIVSRYYTRGKWFKPYTPETTLKQCVDSYIEFLNKTGEITNGREKNVCKDNYRQ